MSVYLVEPGCRDKRLTAEIVSTKWFDSHGKCTIETDTGPVDARRLNFRVVDELTGEAAKLTADELMGRRVKYNNVNCHASDVELLPL